MFLCINLFELVHLEQVSLLAAVKQYHSRHLFHQTTHALYRGLGY